MQRPYRCTSITLVTLPVAIRSLGIMYVPLNVYAKQVHRGVLLIGMTLFGARPLYYSLVMMQVVYNPSEVKYEQLLDTFFAHVDPTTKNRQGNDVGSQYRSAIYYHTPEQKAAAEKVRYNCETAAFSCRT